MFQIPPGEKQRDLFTLCCVCLKKLPIDYNLHVRMTCCGSGFHEHCMDQIHQSTDQQNNTCPALCLASYPTTELETIRRLQKFVDQNEAAWAQTMLAEKYRDGSGVTQSDTQAIELLELAIKQGDAHAMCTLGIFYLNGRGVVQSYKKAIELYAIAAEQGHSNAQYNLASMYYNGDGCEQSIVVAREWYMLAAAQGDEDAHSKLAVLDSFVSARDISLVL